MSAPFGATTAGARELVRSLARSEGIPIAGDRPSSTSDDRINDWLETAGARVRIAIAGYEEIPSDVIRDDIETTAKHLLELYAGSLLADVQHPERSGQGGRLGDVLMSRFSAGLADLASVVAGEVDKVVAQDPTDPTTGVPSLGGAAGRFRPPTGWESVGF